MTAEEARGICGMFGCITGREEKCRYPITMHGRIVVVDSYNLLVNNTYDELVFFRLRYVDKFYAKCEGKRMIKLPHKYKKSLTLKSENEKGMGSLVDASGD